MNVVPCDFAEANAFVAQHHRHHKPMPGAKFSVAVAESGVIVGVAMVGRPVARMLDDGWTLEVNRVGYRKLVTYILNSEPGTSIKAAGWKCLGEAGGGSWSRGSRPRVDKHPKQGKMRWQIESDHLIPGGRQ